jgi:ubiquinone/menaquinone biosynthesis C-methylase UbiE
MNVSCPVCESLNIEIKSDYRGNNEIFAGMYRAHCNSCKMIFATPMPDKNELDKYNANYFESAHGGLSQNKTTTAFFSGIAQLRMAYVERYLYKQRIEVMSLLELGPGTGFFARKWLGNHPQTNYLAIETDNSCHPALKNIGVNQIDLTTLEDEKVSVDLIVISHVLEHVVNPVTFLANVTKPLRKGGAIFIEVPCRDWEHKPIDEPHLLFFDKKPMLHLLRKLGFEIIQVNYYGQEIEKLLSKSSLNRKLMHIRTKLISFGCIIPFSKKHPGMEMLKDPLERAVVSPYNAHIESETPAWWLRAIAIKS